MNIAIIGAGSVGKALAGSCVRAGHSVVLSSANGDTAAAVAAATGARAAESNLAAVRDADIVVLAVPYGALVDVLDEIGPGVVGKIVVDATNPLKPDYSGLAVEGESSAEKIQAKIPGAHVAKAFNTVLAARQAEPSIAGLDADAYVAADDEATRARVLELAKSLGLHPIDAGDLIMARALEAMAFLNISLQMRHEWSWQSAWKLVGPDGDAS